MILDLQTWQMIAGFLMTFLVGAVVRSDWKTWVKFVVAGASSLLVGTIGAWVAGELHGLNSWAAVVIKLFVVAQAAFVLFWKPSQLGQMWENWTDQYHPLPPAR